MSYQTTIEDARRWADREPIGGVLADSKTDGSYLEALLKNGQIQDAGLLKAIRDEGRKSRAELEKLKDEKDSEIRKEKRDQIKTEFTKTVERLKKLKAEGLVESLDKTAEEYDTGQVYDDIPEAVHRDRLELDRFRLQAGIMAEDEALQKIGEAKRTRVYNRDQILTLAQKSDATKRAARELLAEIPPHLANKTGAAYMDEIAALHSAGVGNIPFRLKSGGLDGVAAMSFLRDPIPADPPKPSPISGEAMKRAFETERRTREDNQRQEDLEEIKKIRADLEKSKKKATA